MPDRPPLRLRLTGSEVERFTRAYARAEEDGDYGLRVSLGDQVFVRQQLLARAGDLDEAARCDFEARADRLIELAFYGGIARALAYVDEPLRDVDDAIARHQEFAA